MNADQILADLRTETLTSLRRTARDLHEALERVHRDATYALAQMDQGGVIPGLGLGTGPLGHQNAAQVTKFSAELHLLMQRARDLQIPADEIRAAYKRETARPTILQEV